MAVFVNGDPQKAAGLVAKLDQLVEETPNLKALVVFQSGAEARPALEKLAREQSIQVPLTIPKGAAAEVERLYKLDPKVKNTFMVYKGKKVLLSAVDVTEKSFSRIADAAKSAAKE
ncbi:MAG: hypothetical protein HY321_05790 [Armatimonadetes bacterium]|nr:hypothetical protein [Armatimonadota bacterium]